jgi:hypothetical protein
VPFRGVVTGSPRLFHVRLRSLPRGEPARSKIQSRQQATSIS